MAVTGASPPGFVLAIVETNVTLQEEGCSRTATRADGGGARDAHRGRHGGRPGPIPASDRPGAAGAVGTGDLRRPALARPGRLAPLDHRRDARAALRAS